MTENNSSFPNFMLIGAPKTGTTSLYASMCRHPEIFPSFYKETHFFNTGSEYQKGIEYYLRTYFDGAAKYKCRGDATPAYLRGRTSVAEKIKLAANETDLKFIAVLRDPVLRAWSHYLHRRRSLNEEMTFEEALEHEPELLAKVENAAGYFDCGLYGEQLREWMHVFSNEQFHLIRYEKLFSNYTETLSGVFEFLNLETHPITNVENRKNVAGVPRFPAIMKYLKSDSSTSKRFVKGLIPPGLRREFKTRIRQWNVKPYSTDKPIMADSTETQLRNKYRKDIELLESISGWDCSSWK